MPSHDVVPGKDATLRDFIRFSDTFNPLPHFQEQWGDDYTARVRELWEQCVRAFEDNAATEADIGELLMCLQYDIVLGPALGVPDPHKLRFLRWLTDAIGNRTPAD